MSSLDWTVEFLSEAQKCRIPKLCIKLFDFLYLSELKNMVGENCQGGVNSGPPNSIPSIVVDRINSEDHEFLSTTASINMTGSEEQVKPGAYYTPGMEDRLRRKLKFFFMDPCEKWKAKRRFPWKLGLQVLKILLLTIQVKKTVKSSFYKFKHRFI